MLGLLLAQACVYCLKCAGGWDVFKQNTARAQSNRPVFMGQIAVPYIGSIALPGFGQPKKFTLDCRAVLFPTSLRGFSTRQLRKDGSALAVET